MAFSREQVSELQRLGVTAEQLAELRRILPTCRATICAPSASMTDVRDELEGLHKAVQCALDALWRWGSARVSTPALAEARARVHAAAFDIDDRGTAIGDAADATHLAVIVIAEALARMPKEQRRAQASLLPVYWIHEALLRGWGRTHYPIRRGEGSKDDKGGPIPPYPHAPSSGVRSRFREIVCMCYDAALNTRDSDPDRAIKAFMRWRAKRSQGQQVRGVTDLPS